MLPYCRQSPQDGRDLILLHTVLLFYYSSIIILFSFHYLAAGKVPSMVGILFYCIIYYYCIIHLFIIILFNFYYLNTDKVHRMMYLSYFIVLFIIIYSLLFYSMFVTLVQTKYPEKKRTGCYKNNKDPSSSFLETLSALR